MKNATTIQDLIKRAGGQTAFARQTGIPLRTVQSWSQDVGTSKRKPPQWVVPMLERYMEVLTAYENPTKSNEIG